MRRAAQRIVEKLRLHGHEAFFAGGWVRDHLLRRRPKDIDIATSALPDQVLQLFPNATSIGAQFGVVQVRIYGHAYEIVTFRSDNAYVDGRHPTSISFSGPKQDALRRDFTINGLFYDPIAGRLIDHVHGRNDIQRKLIRTIGNPGDRFAEDKLRMLRAIRLACCLGFTIVPESWDAIRKLAPEILQVSWERIRDELSKLLTGPDPATGLDLLRDSGLMKHILPEVDVMFGIPNSAVSSEVDVFTHTRTAVALLRKPSSVLAFATLLHDAGKPLSYSAEEDKCFQGHASLGSKISEQVCRRLKMSNHEADQVADLVLAHLELRQVNEMRLSAIRRFLRKPNFADHLELYRVNCLSTRRDLKLYRQWLQKLDQYRHESVPAPLLTGDDLIELGYQPGPVFKEILHAVEDLQLDGAFRTREEALEHIRIHFPPAGKAPP
jgi:poly(A) polymerase